MRLFVGVPVSIGVGEELLRVVRGAGVGQVRWVAPENLHLTLVFLGEVGEERLPAIVREVEGLEVVPVRLRVSGVDVFARAGVVVAEVEAAPGLVRLQEQVAERMVRCGFRLEERPYRPHITLARFGRKVAVDGRRLEAVRRQLSRSSEAARGFLLEAVNLYRSHSAAGGSWYEVLAQKRVG